MVQWYYLITGLVLLYSTIQLGISAFREQQLMHSSLAGAALFWTIDFGLRSFGPMLAEIWPQSTVEIIFAWAEIVAVALVLCYLALLIRDSKPVFARFPFAFTALPLLIIITFPLVQNTIVLKDWVIGLYEGGALLIGLLVFGVKTSKDERFTLLTAGLLIFLGCFLAVWLVPKTAVIYDMLWKGLLIFGIGLTIHGYQYAEKHADGIVSGD